MEKLNKRERILQAGIRMFATNGLEKTKISDIVREAGVAQGTYYLYFDSKNALIPAIAENMLQKVLTRMENVICPDHPFPRQLEDIVDETFKVTEDYKDVLVLCYSGLVMTKALDEWEKIYIPYYDWLEQLILTARSKGEVRADLDARMAAKMLIELMEGVAEQIYLFDKDKNLSREYREELIRFIVHAMV